MRPAGLTDHPHRAAIADEVHARPIAIIPETARVRRIAVQLPHAAEAVGEAQAAFAAWCESAGLAPPQGRQHSYEVRGYRVTWELHTEFVTLTWIGPLDDAENWPEGIGLEALSAHALMVQTRIDVIAQATIPERLIPTFNLASLSASAIDGGKAQIATDFVPDEDGFTRIEFAAGPITAVRRGVIVRRLLEVETYRAFALLGLPLARALSPELAAAEDDLGRELEAMAGVDTIEESHAALDTLHALSVRAGRLAERTAYRFAASFAYDEVLRLRLERLNEESVGYGWTLKRYLGNRIEPAIATCRAFEKRQAALAAKLDRAIGLLNTRIGLDMQLQNRSVLSRISDTAQSQYRLQRTVEGLSVIAISYYALGILSYVLTGAEEVTHFSKPLAVALAAPVVILLVWIGVRLVQRRHGDG